jgi:hypothetical protein
MDIGFTRPMGRSISQSTNATHEKPKILVPGPQATHAERQKFINDLLKPGRQRFELSALSEKQLARFVAYFRIKSVDPNDANEVARFIQGYEQYCGNEQRLDRDGAIASLREHIAKEPNPRSSRPFSMNTPRCWGTYWPVVPHGSSSISPTATATRR